MTVIGHLSVKCFNKKKTQLLSRFLHFDIQYDTFGFRNQTLLQQQLYRRLTTTLTEHYFIRKTRYRNIQTAITRKCHTVTISVFLSSCVYFLVHC